MSEQKDIQRLVTWLEGHPGAPPPADLDPEVVEAVYMLRPDLAPAPRVKLEDILARIETGPLADENTAKQFPGSPLASPSEMSRPDPMGVALQTEDIPTELALDRPDPVTEIADSGELVQLSFYQRNRRRLWTGTGTLAAAAVALFMVLPVRQQAALLGEALHEVSQTSAAPAGSMDEDFAPTEGDLVPEEGDSAQMVLEQLAKEELQLEEEPLEADVGDQGLPDGNLLDQRAATQKAARQQKINSQRSPGYGQGFGGLGSSGSGFGGGGDWDSMGGLGSAGATSSSGGSDFSEDGNTNLEIRMAPQIASPSAAGSLDGATQAANRYDTRTAFDFEDVDVEDEMVASEASPKAGAAESRGRRELARKQSAPGRRSRARASADAAAPALADAAPASAPADPEPDATSELDAWATRAQVKDYRSDWYTTVLAASLVAELHEAISLASDAGRYMGAYVPPGVASPNTGAGSDPAAIYAEWILHRDHRVAQDMAWRAAESALRQGQPERALALIAKGRARSSANTPFYAHLLELEGTIRKRQGDLPGALEAWKAAALLNDARSD